MIVVEGRRRASRCQLSRLSDIRILNLCSIMLSHHWTMAFQANDCTTQEPSQAMIIHETFLRSVPTRWGMISNRITDLSI